MKYYMWVHKSSYHGPEQQENTTDLSQQGCTLLFFGHAVYLPSAALYL